MKIVETQTTTSEVTGNIKVQYLFDNGFTGYTINGKGLVLRGDKGGIVSPSTPNWVKASNLIKGE